MNLNTAIKLLRRCFTELSPHEDVEFFIENSRGIINLAQQLEEYVINKRTINQEIWDFFIKEGLITMNDEVNKFKEVDPKKIGER